MPAMADLPRPALAAVPTDKLVELLRRAAATWFRNDDLLLLEELIRRVQKSSIENAIRSLPPGASIAVSGTRND
jgi:hypothetical protein